MAVVLIRQKVANVVPDEGLWNSKAQSLFFLHFPSQEATVLCGGRARGGVAFIVMSYAFAIIFYSEYCSGNFSQNEI